MKTATLLIAAVLMSGCSYFKDLPDITIMPAPEPPVVVEPVVVPEVPAPTPEPVVDRTATKGFKITSVTRKDIRWTGPNLKWKLGGIVKGGVGETHLYRANGKGGKFEHVRKDTRWRPFQNLHNGYGVWKKIGQPKDGEKVTLVLVTYKKAKKQERITVGTFKWVGK